VNKKELIDAIAERSELTKSQAEKALSSFIDTVSVTLSKGDSVELVGFGKFEVKNRAARDGRNPQTGETIKIKASKVPAFKAGKGLKDTVNV
jgi:DNA-binding protein HU-beta|tara:strand:+ start:501496 stop:501771 length:276 start_codon:yes stop_codon:yes gene_type:complete